MNDALSTFFLCKQSVLLSHSERSQKVLPQTTRMPWNGCNERVRSLRIELEFQHFSRFVVGFSPLPLAHRILCRLRQQRVSAFYLYGLYGPVGQNQRFQSHGTRKLHDASWSRINRN